MKYFEFEKAGLKIDRERVLTYSDLVCPLDCTYCFVHEMVSRKQEKHISYLNDEQWRLLGTLPEDVRLVMLGCDTEFFQSKKDALSVLHRIKTLHKDVSVVTKLPLNDAYLDEISAIARDIDGQGNIFSLSISLPCLSKEMLQKYEPGVPSPESRVETLKKAFSRGIFTMLAIRPLLPDLQEDELREIVLKTKDYVHGYYSGPLYLKADTIKNLLPEYEKTHEIQPHWMLNGNTYQEIVKDGQTEFLSSLVMENGKPFFHGAADGVEYLRRPKMHA